ncbi:lysophospholipid acyltransferase family protein [Geosporobacter ferrireducens]|uniref:lysophospholipid acyltransferase family protein n=1 Tax=Geosporobacter ferrireducens TaxID=1424294 RepID=UPI00139CB325|nr:lysophospholipid acyltransferase family protein [Geosporobacter ferrireducens]MTI55338.1 1-acyl-sn-glycerol-3-phosphate acyltransferase [Geosporobacter ferrireducens]
MDFYTFARNLMKIYVDLFYRIEVENLHYIPKEGACIVCSNHIHNLDPVIIGTTIPRKMTYMAKEELFGIKILGAIIRKLGMIPVNRDGADLSAIKNSLKALNSGKVLGIFPEGTRKKKGAPSNVKPGLAMIAIKGKVPIVPVAIISDYKLFRKIKVKVGAPLSFEEYYGQKLSVDTYQELSQKVMEQIETEIACSIS